jgi:hypothetical protein
VIVNQHEWHRAKSSAGANLIDYPRYYLLDKANLAEWHNFGMGWKERVAWFAPILATADDVVRSHRIGAFYRRCSAGTWASAGCLGNRCRTLVVLSSQTPCMLGPMLEIPKAFRASEIRSPVRS